MDFGQIIIGVDPGTSSVGVCLLHGDGTIGRHWSLRPKSSLVSERLRLLRVMVSGVFTEIAKSFEAEPQSPPLVMLEDGIFGVTVWNAEKKIREPLPNASQVSGMMGEARGIIMAEAWRRGWIVRKVAPQSWRSQMTKEEKKIYKHKAGYVQYWNAKLRVDCTTSDEIDACMIAMYGATA